MWQFSRKYSVFELPPALAGGNQNSCSPGFSPISRYHSPNYYHEYFLLKQSHPERMLISITQFLMLRDF
jgi:hypothetical protein